MIDLCFPIYSSLVFPIHPKTFFDFLFLNKALLVFQCHSLSLFYFKKGSFVAGMFGNGSGVFPRKRNFGKEVRTKVLLAGIKGFYFLIFLFSSMIRAIYFQNVVVNTSRCEVFQTFTRSDEVMVVFSVSSSSAAH